LDLPVYRAFYSPFSSDQLRAFRVAGPDGVGPLPLPDEIGYLGSTVLSLSPAPHRLRRTAADEIELFTTAGTLLDGTWASCLRAPGLKMPTGTTIKTSLFTATVRETDSEAKPTRVAFRFQQPLDDPSLVFLGLSNGRLRQLTLPAVGAEMDVVSVRVPPGSSG
ncbi:MAG TPA: hypothetical protein VGG33_08260, partial [Polyangia bacterium]